MERQVNFDKELKKRQEAVEKIIASYLPAEKGLEKDLVVAMNYSMKAGGKRIRPILMKEAYEMFGGEDDNADAFIAAIEMIHTHSLIHDDLPALDDDKMRRGKPTAHVVYGEAVAILSGDALLNYGYETAWKTFQKDVDVVRIRRALEVLLNKTGIHGMLGGQTVDVMNEGKTISRDMLDYIYQNKTAALIESSLMIGAVLAGASKEEVKVMEQLGFYIGMAFQIQDDILDVMSSSQKLGKTAGSDAKNNKATYVSLKGLESAKEEVADMTTLALQLLDKLPKKDEFLFELTKYLMTREQ